MDVIGKNLKWKPWARAAAFPQPLAPYPFCRQCNASGGSGVAATSLSCECLCLPVARVELGSLGSGGGGTSLVIKYEVINVEKGMDIGCSKHSGVSGLG